MPSGQRRQLASRLLAQAGAGAGGEQIDQVPRGKKKIRAAKRASTRPAMQAAPAVPRGPRHVRRGLDSEPHFEVPEPWCAAHAAAVQPEEGGAAQCGTPSTENASILRVRCCC